MFGITLPPGVDSVRILALSGRRGKPPCLWEGPASQDQSAIEAAIASDPRVVRWLRRNHLVQNGVATTNLQIEAFSQGRRIETYPVSEATLLVDKPKRRPGVGDEVALRAFDLAEHIVNSLQGALEERDTIIGRLVERGMKLPDAPQPPAAAAAPQKDFLADFLERGSQFVSLAKMFRELKDHN